MRAGMRVLRWSRRQYYRELAQKANDAAAAAASQSTAATGPVATGGDATPVAVALPTPARQAALEEHPRQASQTESTLDIVGQPQASAGASPGLPAATM